VWRASGNETDYFSKAIKRRRTIFSKLKCISIISESGIGAGDSHKMEDGCYGFAMTGSEIALVRGEIFLPFLYLHAD
jgi:hypothetical protein